MFKNISLFASALFFICNMTYAFEGGDIGSMDRYVAAMQAANVENISNEERMKQVQHARDAAQEIQTSPDSDVVMSGVINEAYTYLITGEARKGYALLLQKAPLNVSAAMAIEYLFSLGAIQFNFDRESALQKMNEAIYKAGPGELQTHFIMLRDRMKGLEIPVVEGSITPISLSDGSTLTSTVLSKVEIRSTKSCGSQMLTVCDRTCYYPPNSNTGVCEPANCATYDFPRCSQPPVTP